MASAKNPWVRRRRVKLPDLANEPWVLPRPVSGSIFAQVFRASGLDYPRPTVFTSNPQLRINLLASGRFLSIFSTSILRFPTNNVELKVLHIELPLPRVPVGIVTLKNRTLSPVARLFIDTAREVAKPLAKRERRHVRS